MATHTAGVPTSGLNPEHKQSIVDKDPFLSRQRQDSFMASAKASAFTAKLSKEALDHFNSICAKPFSEQAVHFLNAYWTEVGSQAEFIFSVAWEVMKMADMHMKGISLIHLYEEGNDVDFNVGLYFYEKLCKKVLEDADGKKWRVNPDFAPSMPEMLTAIVRKQELREKVDVNFDGRISFLEYLLYQYRAYANPMDFCERAMAGVSEDHPDIVKARAALDDVTRAIRAYEQEKARLEEESTQPGVRGLAARHTLAQLSASSLAEKLNKALITAEAAVRLVTKRIKKEIDSGGSEGARQGGTAFWMSRELEEKKKLYGRRASKFT